MELMVGMFVFSVLSIGATASVIQVRRLAQVNVLRTAAATVAQGYLEQIMSMNPADVEAASEPWVTSRPSLPTESVNSLLNNTTAIEVSDPLWVSPLSAAPSGSNMTARSDVAGDMWNVKQVMVDMYKNKNGTLIPVNMQMRLDVNVKRAWQQINGVWQPPTVPYMLIRIDYQFQGSGYMSAGWMNGTVRMARTDIAGN